MADILRQFVAAWDYVPVTVRNDLVEDYFDAKSENREIEYWVVHTPYDDISAEAHEADCGVNNCIEVINRGMNNPFIRCVMQRWRDTCHGFNRYELEELRHQRRTVGARLKYELCIKLKLLSEDEKLILGNRVMQSMFVRDIIGLDDDNMNDSVKDICEVYNKLFSIGMESMVWPNIL